MFGEDPAEISHYFDGLVPDQVIAAYVKLAAVGGVPKEQAAQFLGDPDLVDALTERGMAHALPHKPTTPPTFGAASPDLALHGVLAHFQARLAAMQRLLSEGQGRLAEAQASATQLVDGVPTHLARIITDRDEIMRLSAYLVNTARKDWMSLETCDTDMPLTDDYPIDAPSAVNQHVRMRAVYDIAFTQDPIASRLVERSVALGEIARVLPDVPVKMQIADENSVLIALTRTGTGGALLIKAKPVTRAMRLLFDLLWAKATPYGGAAGTSVGELAPLDRRILELLAANNTDEAIGKAVGRSKSAVRRHIKAMEDRLGLKNPSRFGFGIAVGRAGWLNCSDDDLAQHATEPTDG